MISFIIAHWLHVVTSLIIAAQFAFICHQRDKMRSQAVDLDLTNGWLKNERVANASLRERNGKLEREKKDYAFDYEVLLSNKEDIAEQCARLAKRVNAQEPTAPRFVRRKTKPKIRRIYIRKRKTTLSET